MSIKEKIEATLIDVAESLEISNFDVSFDETAIKGDGFLSEFFTGSVKNKDMGVVTEVYIKYPPRREVEIKNNIFENEYRYYSNIYPKLQKFQKEKCLKDPFNKVPFFYCGSGEPEQAYVALENLKLQDYVLWDKTKFLDEKHLNTIFKTYGKYHALTFAFKDQNQEKNQEMLKGLHDIYDWIFGDHSTEWLLKVIKTAYEDISEIDEKKAEKLVPLLDDVRTFLRKAIKYEGKCSALTHGDCWSNNMMFKYDKNGNIENLRLLDYQLIRESTPVHDLSYFFYAGASKEDLDKLDHYLEIYYNSFCSFARELGSDPEKLLPFDVLKDDWKKYSVMGINISLLVWQAKLISKEEIAGFDDDKTPDNMNATFEKVKKGVAFRNIAKNIFLHAVEYGII